MAINMINYAMILFNNSEHICLFVSLFWGLFPKVYFALLLRVVCASVYFNKNDAKLVFINISCWEVTLT